MFLLDTNVISELRRPEKADPAVVAWASTQPAASQFLSAISILEIELGARLVERRDGAQGAVLRAWIDNQELPAVCRRGEIGPEHDVCLRGRRQTAVHQHDAGRRPDRRLSEPAARRDIS